MTEWHVQSKDKVMQELGVKAERGLEQAEVSRRQQQYGPNELVDRGTKSPWKILLEQFTGTMTLILIISAAISIFWIQEPVDGIVIMVIVIMNAILGFTQEYNAEKAMAALKKMAVPHVKVRRDGHIRELSARELVPGDIILLEAGNAIPADCRVVESINLRAQEAILTGESEPVEKHADALSTANLSLGDRRNTLYLGTIITYGRGTAVVTGTGMQTELGHIADMIQSVGSEATPLQRRLEQLSRGLAVAALVIVVIVFLLGVLRGEDLTFMFRTAISMAVAAIPEGLTAVVTIALALGAQRMLKRNALIRKLPAVETLGSVTVICSDKTGTLTQNRMTVTILDVAGNQINLQERLKDYSPTVNKLDQPEPFPAGETSVPLLLLGASLCNDATLEEDSEQPGEFSAVGDPTEGALVIAAARSGFWKSDLEAQLPRVAELPFDSERKRMTTLHAIQPGKQFAAFETLCEDANQVNARLVAFTKGAVDGMLEQSTHVLAGGCVQPLDETWKHRIQKANNELSENGMRVLGVAYRFHASVEVAKSDDFESGLVMIGLVGMIDPARPEVKDAVATAKSAGVRTIMITGDHPLTALHIARDLGITQNAEVVTGQELQNMSLDQLEVSVEKTSVYARVSPDHKLKIVEALQNKGQIVAMTGDGVNDAPALKRADIGVAMGITGTDVSKEAADMVLVDDNFATIVNAIEEGRRIYDNIRKFIRYILASNVGEVLVMLVAPFLGMPLPLLPLQILWINLITDGLPALALTLEPTESNTMKRPPHPPKESVFARGLGQDVLWIGALVGLVSLGVGFLGFQIGSTTWQTMVFTTLALAQMGNVMAIRAERDSVFTVGLFSNKMLVGTVILTILLQIAVVYLPFLQGIFDTVALSAGEFALCVVASVIVFAAVELVKAVRRRIS